MNKTLNEKYFDESIKRGLLFLDFTEQQINEVSKENDRLEEALLIALIKQYKEVTPTRANTIKLRNRLKSLEGIYSRHYDKIIKLVQTDYKGIGVSEYEFNRDFFKENLGVPVALVNPAKSITGITKSKNMLGRPLLGGNDGNWFKDLSKTEYKKFITRVQAGFSDGLGLSEIVKSIKGTKALGYRDGVFKTAKKNLRTLVRTSYTFIQQEASKEVFNEIGATHLRYSAILDAKTTFICGQRDGNIYIIIEAPIIPAHFNCRSTYVSVFDAGLIAEATTVRDPLNRRRVLINFRTDTRTSYGASKFDKLSKSQQERAIKAVKATWAKDNIGNPVGRTKYRDWFEERTEAWKISRLGQKRFDLYKIHGLKYMDLANKNGKAFTIKELNQKYNNTKGL